MFKLKKRKKLASIWSKKTLPILHFQRDEKKNDVKNLSK